MAIVTYDENGNYGHPDHINAARIARDAHAALAGGPDAVSRFYEIAFARETWTGLMEEMRSRGINFPWGPPDEAEGAVSGEASEAASGPDDAETDEFGRPDAEITTRIDVSAQLEHKRRSMDCHRTQRQDMGWLLELPDDLAAPVLGTEAFVLTLLDGEAVPATHREEWLLG
jgi:LmbE family N-acetylglucosaminyl deacetylase